MRMEIKNMKEFVKIIKLKGKEYLIMKMEINYMKGIGKKVNMKEKE